MDKYRPLIDHVAPTEERPVENGLVWDFNLPPLLDADRLVINTRRLALMQRIGGIATSVVQDYQGDRSDFTPGIAGINGDGTALATKAGTYKEAEAHKENKIDLFDRPMSARFGKIVSSHLLNKAEIAANVSEKVGKGITREQAWAEELDENLRTSIHQVSKENLTGRTYPL